MDNLTSRRHGSLRRIALIAAALLALLVAGTLYVLIFGLRLDVSHRGRALAADLSARLGREVIIEGPLLLNISARPSLRLERLSVANPADFDSRTGAGAALLQVGEARLALDLWRLLKLRLSVEELSAHDIVLRLQSRSDGANNWTLATRPAPSPAGAPAPGRTADPLHSLARILSHVEVGRIALGRLAVEYRGPQGKTHYFDLDRLAFHWMQGEPFSLSLRGSVEKRFPYTVELSGGSLEQLAIGQKSWPFAANLSFLGTLANFEGEYLGAHARVAFALGASDHSEIERLLQVDLPDVGAIGLAGELDYRAGKIALSRLNGVLGRTTVSGALEIETGVSRPVLRGALDLPELDLRPFMAERPHPDRAPPRSLAELYRDISDANFDLRSLATIDADLRLRVGHWLSLPGEVRDSRLAIRLHNGRLRMPLGATISGVALSGEASIDSSLAQPSLRIALAARDSSLGGLAELLTGAQGVAGHLGSFELRIAARGGTGAQLLHSLDARIAIERARLSYGNFEGGRPVDFQLERLALEWPSGGPLVGEARGSLLGHALSASLRGAPIAELLREGRTPVDLEARATNVYARVHGILQTPTGERGSELAFELNAPHAGEVAHWFGFVPGAEARLATQGRISVRRDSWRLSDFALHLGRTSISGELEQDTVDARSHARLRLSADSIDIAELESIVPQRRSEPSHRSAAARATLDIPILPSGVSLADADIEVKLRRFSGIALALGDVAFDGRIREGRMLPSPFAANVAGIDFRGAVSLDFRGAEPQAALWLMAEEVAVGRILRDLHLSRDLDLHFDRVRLSLAARASRLGELLARSELNGEVEGGRLTLRHPGTGRAWQVALDRGVLAAAPGIPLGLNLRGSVEQSAVAIAIETAPAQDLVNPAKPLPFELSIEAAESKLRLTGRVERPAGKGDIQLALETQGPRFDSLNRLAHTALPPWGPWSASGRLLVTGGGYRLDDLRLKIGDSLLGGQAGLALRGARPRLDVALKAPNIQLDDFRFGEWSPAKKDPTPKESASSGEARLAGKVDHLLGRETLLRLDAALKVEVEHVYSGKDRLGEGRLEVTLADGVANLGPAEVKLPGGLARLSLLYAPGEQDVRMSLRIGVDHLDYGVLARRIAPETPQRGVMSLRVEVDARAELPSEMLSKGSGRIEFALWPESLKAGVFDLWAVNVLESILPAMDSSRASKVNCAIGRFVLKDGRLTARTMLVDTGRMRVNGTGDIDYVAQTLRLRMEPKAKRPEFLSLA
ncbi:MAG: hypothetical protein OEW21_15600, partial [Betaproteobacteria bacterium]|nr:hypothetical protein [Betaproteobacteria bacterium]